MFLNKNNIKYLSCGFIDSISVCMMAISQRLFTFQQDSDLDPDVGLSRVGKDPGLRLHPVNRSSWPWQGLASGLHPE